jgi:hypothetical protein
MKQMSNTLAEVKMFTVSWPAHANNTLSALGHNTSMKLTGKFNLSWHPRRIQPRRMFPTILRTNWVRCHPLGQSAGTSVA